MPARLQAAAVQWQAGSTASITGPWCNSDEAARASDRSGSHSSARARSACPSADRAGSRRGAVMLECSGFQHAADLLDLVSLKKFVSRCCAPNSSISLERYEGPQKERLVRLVERTYQDTLDCPTLNGVRSIADVVEGYRSIGRRCVGLAGRSLPDKSQDVGCLLLAEHPAHSNLEVVYVGVTPEHRGHGFGVALTRDAQWIARERGLDRVVLAVDAANSPA